MCLYTRESKPRVAKKDITVCKYVKLKGDNMYSPFLRTQIPVNEVMEALPKDVNIYLYNRDILEKNIYALGKGAIHAKIYKEDYYVGKPKKAIIPAGTEYWVSMFGEDIAARSMIITDDDWDDEKNTVSESLFEEILEDAPESNGIKIGDYLLENGSYTRPRKDLSEDDVVGIVAGFRKNKPLIAALKFFKRCYDTLGSCSFRCHYHFM